MENKSKYMISIIGEQSLDGQKDKIEVLTEGNFIMRNGNFHIGYKEFDDDEPQKFTNNIIRVDGDVVTISRRGPLKSQLFLEKGKRHQCVYETVAGVLSIGVFTKTLNNNLNKHGGKLEVSYTLDFNSDFVSDNKFTVEVTEKQISANEVE